MHEPFQGHFFMIPTFIADDPDIDDSTFKLFGRIVSLSNKNGYCWASNAYFAEVSRVKVRIIQYRLKTLENKGYIIKEAGKNGTKDERKIFPVLTHPDSKNCYPCTVVHPPMHVRAPPIYRSNNIILREQQQPAAAVVVFSCLEKESRIAKRDWKWFMTYSEEKVQYSIARALELEAEGKITRSFTACVKWILKEDIKLQEIENVEENIRWAKKMENNLVSENYKLETCGKYALISPLRGNVECIELKYTELNFKDKLAKALKDKRFKKNES